MSTFLNYGVFYFLPAALLKDLNSAGWFSAGISGDTAEGRTDERR